MAEQDPAERLAAALVEEFHGDHGAALEEAAAAGEVAARFAEALDALRDTFARRFDAAALGGRDPLGHALRALVGRFGPAEQLSLAEDSSDAGPGDGEAALADASAAASGDADARVARLRAALRDARRRVRRLEAENQALREELLSAGEMIETLALDLEKPIAE